MSVWMWILGLLLLILGIWLHHHYIGWKARRRLKRVRAQGQAGEIKAESWLRRNGFVIEAGQPQQLTHLLVDGIPTAFRVRADFVVRDPEGRRAVVEVKTGAATNPVSTATRRQMLEYAVVYGVESIYLFDGVEGRLRKVSFRSQLPRSPGFPASRLLAVGFGLGIMVTVSGMLLLRWVQ